MHMHDMRVCTGGSVAIDHCYIYIYIITYVIYIYKCSSPFKASMTNTTSDVPI